MEILKSTSTRKKCTLVLEATEDSQPFEKRVVKFRPGADVGVGRVSPKAAFSLHRTLLFENKIISKRHASITFDGSKFILKDLGSSNGTYLNDKLIGDAESDPASKIAVEVKTGDIVRFGVSRIAFATEEVCKAIVGRLTLIPPRTTTNETMGQERLKSFTPFEGYREHEGLPTKCNEKMTEDKTTPEKKTCHRDAETEPVSTTVNETQTMDENVSTKGKIVKESQAHVLVLWQGMVIALTVIVGYQMYLTFFCGTI